MGEGRGGGGAVVSKFWVATCREARQGETGFSCEERRGTGLLVNMVWVAVVERGTFELEL